MKKFWRTLLKRRSPGNMPAITIAQEKRPGRTDSTFYTGQIAFCKLQDGRLLSLEVFGETDVQVDGKRYHNRQGIEEILDSHLTDEVLASADVDWRANTWFELITFDPDGVHDGEPGVVSMNYDEALEDLAAAFNEALK